MSARASGTGTYTGQDVIREALLRYARSERSRPGTYVISTSPEESLAVYEGDERLEWKTRRDLTALDFYKIDAVNTADAILALSDRLREIGDDNVYDQICTNSDEFISDDVEFLLEHPDLLPDEGETLDAASFEKYVDKLEKYACDLEACALYMHEHGICDVQVATMRRLEDLKPVCARATLGPPARPTSADAVRDMLETIGKTSPLTPDVYVVDVIWPEELLSRPVQTRLIDLTNAALEWKIEADSEAGALVALFDNLREIDINPRSSDRKYVPCDMYKAIAEALPESSASDADEVLAQARRHCDGGEAAEYIRLKRVGTLENLQSPLAATRLVKSADKRC